MTSTITQWHEYSEEEKVAWLLANVLNDLEPKPEGPTKYDLTLLARCEAKLNEKQRQLYVKYMNSDIAIITYKGLSDDECRSPEVSDRFYWNYATAPVDLRGRIIWNIIADFAP